MATVPEHVRARFERCRSLHTYGCFAYEFFSIAVEYAYTTLEAALGARFVTSYAVGIPVEDEGRRIEHLHPTFYSEVTEALRRPHGSHPHRRTRGRGWVLQGHPRFDGSLRSLLDWAWATGHLRGRRNRVVESALYHLRNMAAHPHGPHLVSKVESAGAIADMAEIINHLWGQDTPGGRLYGTPPVMTVVCLHRAAGGNAAVFPSRARLEGAGESDRESPGLWALLEVAHADEAFGWVPGHEWTTYPATAVWSGDSWATAVAAWQAYERAGRQPHSQPWRDRLFLMRCSDTTPQRPLELPRSPAQFRALAPEQRDPAGTTWWIVRADHPGDTLAAWQDITTLPVIFQHRDRDDLFPAHVELESATWQQAEAWLVDLGQ